MGQILRERITPARWHGAGRNRARVIDAALAEQIAKLGDVLPEVRIVPEVTDEIVFLSADEEDRYTIAQANAATDGQGHFTESRVSVRRNQKFLFEVPDHIEYMDVSPKQIVSVSAALIPFLEHDDANRALMGSNMQRQAVPLLRPEAPIVGTGMERQAAVDSGQVVVAAEPRRGRQRHERRDHGAGRRRHAPHVYRLRKYQRSNQSTCIDQRPVVQQGRPGGEGPGAGRLQLDRAGRDGAGPERAGGLPDLGGRQL